MDYLYRANDGTIFYDEDECADYETKLKYDLKAFNGIRLWDENDKEFSLEDLLFGNKDTANIWSVYFPNREIGEQFEKMIQDIYDEDVFDYSVEKIDKGFYTYNTAVGSWVNIEKDLQTFATRVKSFGFTLNYELNFD